jgi:hypothetical protein
MAGNESDLYDLLFDSSTKVAVSATKVVGEDPARFQAMLEFALRDEKQFAMRAIRVINFVTEKYPELILPYLSRLINGMPNYKTIGLKRGVAKILSENYFNYNEDDAGILVDTCFNWLNDSAEPIAMKIYSMEILYRVSKTYPDIKPELISSIENELPRESAAIRGRGRRILKKLYKEVG